jgi:hypothetical protein
MKINLGESDPGPPELDDEAAAKSDGNHAQANPSPGPYVIKLFTSVIYEFYE